MTRGAIIDDTSDFSILEGAIKSFVTVRILTKDETDQATASRASDDSRPLKTLRSMFARGIFKVMRVILFISVLVLCSCSHRMIETSLYFGQSRPDGTKVTDEEWLKFKNTYVLKVFKEGATAIPVSGNWYDPDQSHLISEATYIVVYLHKPSASLSRQIDDLREQYKKLYGQQSVMRIDKKVVASF